MLSSCRPLCRSIGLVVTVARCRLVGIMTSHDSSTRERLIDATVSLMRTKGAAASGTKEILELAGAPRGSFYHHFPNGKDQLVLAALERAAAATLLSLTEPLADGAGSL